MKAPMCGISREHVSHSRPLYRFPAAIMLQNATPLYDALIGHRRWDDSEVLLERNIVLGSDDDTALNYITLARTKLLQNFFTTAQKMESIERQVFGEKSFFVNN